MLPNISAQEFEDLVEAARSTARVLKSRPLHSFLPEKVFDCDKRASPTTGKKAKEEKKNKGKKDTRKESHTDSKQQPDLTDAEVWEEYEKFRST